MRGTGDHPPSLFPTFPEDSPLAWAAICGAVSAGIRWEWATLWRVAIAVVLAEFIFRWAACLVSRHAPKVRKVPSSSTMLPYTVPHSLAQRFSDHVTHACAKIGALWTLPRGSWLRNLVFFLAAGALLSYGLGLPAVWAGIVGLVLATLSGLWLKVYPNAARAWAPLVWVTLAWLMGTLAAGGTLGWHMTAALVFGVAASGLAAFRGGKAWGRALTLVGLTGPGIILIANRLLGTAAATLLVAVPAYVLVLREDPASEERVRTVYPLLWTSMAVTALALAF